jgi:carboxyl-terminal processing protease
MSRVRTVGSIALVAAAAWSGVWLIQRAVRTDRAASDGARLLDAVMLRVRDSYVDEVDAEQLWELATAGMIDELGDPNSAYLTPERLERLERLSSNSYVGVGLSVDVREGWVTVSQPRAGSPAERAGILTGDRLVEVDGSSMRGSRRRAAPSAGHRAPRSCSPSSAAAAPTRGTPTRSSARRS